MNAERVVVKLHGLVQRNAKSVPMQRRCKTERCNPRLSHHPQHPPKQQARPTSFMRMSDVAYAMRADMYLDVMASMPSTNTRICVVQGVHAQCLSSADPLIEDCSYN